MDQRQVVLKRVLDEVGLPLQLSAFLDRLAVQKTIYLMQLANLDLGYRFGWYKYGPYCRDLTSDAFQLLEALDGGESIPADLPLSPLAKQLIGRAKAIWADRPGQVPHEDWLELLASLHYLKHIVYWPSGRSRDFDAVFGSLVTSKPKFQTRQNDARLAWDRLGSVGLLDRKVMASS